LQCCIFSPSFGMHKKTSWPNICAVSIGTTMYVELSNVIAVFTFFYWI
jgi:hypothetical protein